jgi:hypothetical protein
MDMNASLNQVWRLRQNNGLFFASRLSWQLLFFQAKSATSTQVGHSTAWMSPLKVLGCSDTQPGGTDRCGGETSLQ